MEQTQQNDKQDLASLKVIAGATAGSLHQAVEILIAGFTKGNDERTQRAAIGKLRTAAISTCHADPLQQSTNKQEAPGALAGSPTSKSQTPSGGTYSAFLDVAHSTGVLGSYTDNWLTTEAYQVCTDYNQNRPAGEGRLRFMDAEVQYLEGGPMMDPGPAQGLVNAVFTVRLCNDIAHGGQGD